MHPISWLLIAAEYLLVIAYVALHLGRYHHVEWATPWALLLIAPILGLAIKLLRGQSLPRLGFTHGHQIRTLPTSLAAIIRPAVLQWAPLGLLLAALALARPQTTDGTPQADTQGIDIVLTLDISRSMEAADFKPNNRLFVAKQMLSEIISERKHDRLGLVIFSGAAYTQVPLTLDYRVLDQILGGIKTGIIEDGTAIGDALATALNRLRHEKSKSKVILLLTDGDNNAGSLPPLEAAHMAAELGIQIYTILIGKEGAVPFPTGRDIFGNITYTEARIPINPGLLKQIADTTHALFLRAENGAELRQSLHQALNHLEKTKFEETPTQIKYELYLPLLWAALILLCLERILVWTRFKILVHA